MQVNGLPLPEDLVAMISEGRTRWMLKAGVDAYGHHFSMDALELISDPQTIAGATAELAEGFPSENNADHLFGDMPGVIPWVLDFSRIVCFGHMGERDPVCFDYRADQRKPSVIFWADAYWRLLAPSFESFMDLFEPFDMDMWLERGLASMPGCGS